MRKVTRNHHVSAPGGGVVDRRERLRLFDAATRRHAPRQSGRKRRSPTNRGWTRDALYGQTTRAR